MKTQDIIAEDLEAIATDIRNINPQSKAQANLIILDLYEVMRRISDLAENENVVY